MVFYADFRQGAWIRALDDYEEYINARVLISYLIENPCQFLVDGEESRLIQPNRNHFTGRIFLLMNGGSFSATVIVISTLQRDHRIILVGEETAGNRHIISGDPEMFILPSTHMQCFISTKNYEILTGVNDSHGVLPDYYVHPTIGDLLSGIDAPMVLSLTIK